MTRKTLHRMAASAGILLSGTALAACTPAATAGTGAPASSPGPTASSVAAGYPGYQWRMVSISHDGKITAIAAAKAPVMQFSPDGMFFATDGVSEAYSGTYRAASHAFIISNIFEGAGGYLDGYAPHDPIALLTSSIMFPFVQHARHPVQLTGDQLVVSSGSYALTYHRDGRQFQPPIPVGADWPLAGGLLISGRPDRMAAMAKSLSRLEPIA